MSADGEFTIRVTGPPPPPAKKNVGKSVELLRYNLRLRPSASLEQMRRDVFALFDVPSDSIGAYQMSFFGGFPPKELEQAGKGTVHELGIRPNESLIVKFALIEGSSAGAAAASVSAASEPEAAVASGTGRQKRASAMAANASFKEAIAAQDELMKQGKPSPKKRGASTSANGNVVGFGTAGRRTGGKAAAAGKNPKKVKIEGAGYRLSDGKSFAGSSQPKKSAGGNKRVKALFQGHGDVAQGKEDIANKVLSSLAKGSKGGNVGRFVRSAMKGALEKSYEASRARVRVTAVDQGEFSFVKASSESVDSAGMVLGAAGQQQLGLCTVSYSKGMEGRGRCEEQVMVYGEEAVKSVLRMVYNTANESGENDMAANPTGDQDGRLRPALMAQLSPRIFWSLVFHCSEAAKNFHNPALMPTSVNEMLRTTLPELDWSHLDRGGRNRVLSEKARENLRQLKDKTTKPAAEENGAEEVEEDQVQPDEFSLVVRAVVGRSAETGNEGTDNARAAWEAVANLREGNLDMYLFKAVASMNAVGVSSRARQLSDSFWFMIAIKIVGAALFCVSLNTNTDEEDVSGDLGDALQCEDNGAASPLTHASSPGDCLFDQLSDDDVEHLLRRADDALHRAGDLLPGSSDVIIDDDSDDDDSLPETEADVWAGWHILLGLMHMIHRGDDRVKVEKCLCHAIQDCGSGERIGSMLLSITANALAAKMCIWRLQDGHEDSEEGGIDGVVIDNKQKYRTHHANATHALSRLGGMRMASGEAKLAYLRLRQLIAAIEADMTGLETSTEAENVAPVNT